MQIDAGVLLAGVYGLAVGVAACLGLFRNSRMTGQLQALQDWTQRLEESSKPSEELLSRVSQVELQTADMHAMVLKNLNRARVAQSRAEKGQRPAELSPEDEAAEETLQLFDQEEQPVEQPLTRRQLRRLRRGRA